MKTEWIIFALIIIGAIIGIIYKKRKGKLGNYDAGDDMGPGGLIDMMD